MAPTGPREEVSQESNPLFRLFLAENIVARLRNAAGFNVFIDDMEFNACFGQLVAATHGQQERAGIEEIRDLHGKLVTRLRELTDPDTGEISQLDKARTGPARKSKIQIPKGFENFDSLVAELKERLAEEDQRNAYASAADSLILGEVDLDAFVLMARQKIQKEALAVLRKESPQIGPDGQSAFDGEEVLDQIAVPNLLELLKLSDERLLQAQSELGKDISHLILSVRQDIRGGYTEGARSQEERFEQMGSLLFYPEEPDPDKKAEERASLTSVEAALRAGAIERAIGALGGCPEENILRMRAGVPLPEDQPLEFSTGPTAPNRLRAVLAGIEARAFKVTTGRDPGAPKQERPPTRRRHLVVLPPLPPPEEE